MKVNKDGVASLAKCTSNDYRLPNLFTSHDVVEAFIKKDEEMKFGSF